MVRLAALVSLAVVGCGATAATEEETAPSTGPPTNGSLTDDPARARAFQAPLELFVRPLDRALDELLQGATPAEAFGDVVVDEPLRVEGLRARVEASGGARIEVGELEMVLVVIKDRGPPDNERYERTTVELTAVRPGGAFRLTRLHTELHRQQSAPAEPPNVVEGWAVLRDALVESLAGPDCRFVPVLREADLTGVYDGSEAERLREAMPERAVVDRFCADLWDRSPPNRTLEVRSARFYVVDRQRNVKATIPFALEARDQTIALGPVE
jgi:hypothetical protein